MVKLTATCLVSMVESRQWLALVPHTVGILWVGAQELCLQGLQSNDLQPRVQHTERERMAGRKTNPQESKQSIQIQMPVHFNPSGGCTLPLSIGFRLQLEYRMQNIQVLSDIVIYGLIFLLDNIQNISILIDIAKLFEIQLVIVRYCQLLLDTRFDFNWGTALV